MSNTIINRDNIIFPNVKESQASFLSNDKQCKIPGYRALYDDNTNNFLGLVQSNYKVIQYSEIVELFEIKLLEVFNKLSTNDITINRNIIFTKQQKRMFAIYNFPTMEFDIANDKMYPRVTLESSFDRTKKLQFSFSIMRLICSNGLMIADMTKGFGKLHTKNINTDNFIEVLLNDIINIINNKSIFYKLSNIVIDKFKYEHLYELKQPIFSFPKRYLDKVEYNFEKERENTDKITVWHLYNAFNSVINHFIIGEKDRFDRGQALDINLFNVFKEYYCC